MKSPCQGAPAAGGRSEFASNGSLNVMSRGRQICCWRNTRRNPCKADVTQKRQRFGPSRPCFPQRTQNSPRMHRPSPLVQAEQHSQTWARGAGGRVRTRPGAPARLPGTRCPQRRPPATAARVRPQAGFPATREACLMEAAGSRQEQSPLLQKGSWPPSGGINTIFFKRLMNPKRLAHPLTRPACC